MITSAFLKTLSLNAPRNCVMKKGPNRRSPSSLNWLWSAIGSPPPSGVPAHIVGHRGERRLEPPTVDPEVDLAAALLAREHARLAQDLQVMRHRRPAERRGGCDRTRGQALALLEHEQDALPVCVAERDEHLRDRLPGAGNAAQIGTGHARSGSGRNMSKCFNVSSFLSTRLRPGRELRHGLAERRSEAATAADRGRSRSR